MLERERDEGRAPVYRLNQRAECPGGGMGAVVVRWSGEEELSRIRKAPVEDRLGEAELLKALLNGVGLERRIDRNGLHPNSRTQDLPDRSWSGWCSPTWRGRLRQDRRGGYGRGSVGHSPGRTPARDLTVARL